MNWNKYRAVRTTVNGIPFASKKEAARYQVLRLMEKCGKISNLQLQPRFTLQPLFVKKDGKVIRPIIYIADFLYLDESGKTIVEDCKGFKTKDFRIKQKMFEFKNPNIELVLT